MVESAAILPYQGSGNPIFDAQSALAKSIFSATKDVSCPLYKNYPGFMTGSMFGSPTAAQSDALLNQLCSPTGNLPAPPSRNFTGGQCVGVFYNAAYTFTLPGEAPVSSNAAFNGKLTSFQVERTTTGDGNVPAANLTLRFTRNGDNVQVVNNLVGGAAPGLILNSVTITRVDGLADSCGDPPLAYPFATPLDIEINPTVNLQVSPNFNVTVPVNVFAPVEIFAPSLKIGDFNVDFSLGGLTISPTINIGGGGKQPPGKPVQQPPSGSKPSDRNQDNINDLILRYLKRLRDCQECDLDYNFATSSAVVGNSGSVSAPSGAVPLVASLRITSFPVNAKIQNGVTEADVLFSGWGWWSGGGFYSERFPIDAQFKLIHSPIHPSCDTFHWTLYTGFVGTANVSYKSLKNPLPPI